MDLSRRGPDPRVFVIGDLNVDRLLDTGRRDTTPCLRPGGTAFNGALALRDAGFDVTVVGAVGEDADGRYVEKALKRLDVAAHLVRCRRPTGTCTLHTGPGSAGRISNGNLSANAVEPARLAATWQSLGPRPNDVVFVATHVFVRHSWSVCMAFFRALRGAGSRLVVDLVPHDLAERVSGEMVASCLRDAAFLLVAELGTMRALLKPVDTAVGTPEAADWDAVFDELAPLAVALRHGRFGVEFESIARACHVHRRHISVRRTDFERYPDVRGFGDRLTATLLRSLL